MNRIFKYQGFHLLGFIVIGFVLIFTTFQQQDSNRVICGLTAFQWAIFSWICAGIHQAWVLLFWRIELYYKKISSLLGKNGFTLFRTGFSLFGLLRFLSLIPISLTSAESIALPLFISISLVGVTLPLITWGLYSVIRYFGVNRAFGMDHFDPAFREGTLEKRGIYKYIPNSMYIIVLLLLYYPGLLLNSIPGLIAAVAHHLFVWFHYYCTEKPVAVKEMLDLR